MGRHFRTGLSPLRRRSFCAYCHYCLGSLRSSGAIMRWVGKGIEAISRLMGFLLVCMGVQFIINGVLEIVKTYH